MTVLLMMNLNSMKQAIIGSIILLVFIIYFLYRLGKKVKDKEEEIKYIFEDKKRHNRFAKYSRKNYAKTPTIKK